MIERKLTDKQQAFVDYYVTSGNAEEAARKAGYNARGNTTKLLQNTTIKKAIEVLNKQIENERIDGMTEVKQFWTETMRNESVEQKDLLHLQQVQQQGLVLLYLSLMT
ncbi:terminase small subunit [Psychrobacillus sp. FSL K6-1415]|uniref:terminase small subunit n=1 Tax=Psychrobacillus sp. FSL K6-1415 TaxID=2921544 RepID=UPI0030FCDEE7